MEKKKIQIWLPLLFSITMIAGMFLGYKMRDGIPGKKFFHIENRRTVQEVMDIIERKYVDTVDMNALSDTAIEAILAKLDPHSTYIPAEDLQSANEEIAGNFFGIGVEFNIFNDTIHVLNVLKDGPSFKAGLQSGDQILQADDSVLSGKKLTTERIRKNLRGPLGSSLNLVIYRNSKTFQVKVARGIIPVSSVDASYMMDKNIGYIRLNKFSKQTYREFMESLEALKNQGLQKLILDLRGNGGGVLDEAVEIADEFLEGDKLITYTEGSHSKKKEYRCRREGQFEKGPLVVLTDEGSASASEILMGALQDWDRATIVGRRSFGKGLVQEQFDLGNNSALRLTIARYFTPVGRSIQRPYADGGKVYYDEILNRYNNGAMVSADSVKADSSKIYRTKGGKKIFGGGGITPDYFVAADTSTVGSASIELFNKGLYSSLAYRYYLQNKNALSRYNSPAIFARQFVLSENDWKFFTSLSAKDSVNLANVSAKEKTAITKVLTSYIARQLYRTVGYFEVVNAEDETINRAIEILNR
jgi:carboxyl-terminal processing protease